MNVERMNVERMDVERVNVWLMSIWPGEGDDPATRGLCTAALGSGGMEREAC